MIRLALPFAALMMLAACEASEPPPADTASASPDAPAPAPGQTSEPTPAPAPDETTSCAADIGEEAAAALVERCIQVSPATRPPCNVANPCALIQSEIDRSCELWERDEDVPAACAG